MINKKIKLLFIVTFATLIVTNVNGQELYKCDTTKSFWAFAKDSLFLAVELRGNVKATERKTVLSVNNYVLQNIFIDKTKYVKSGEDNSDIKLLTRFAISESEYFSNLFKTKINIRLQQAPLSTGKNVLIWFFEMPPGMDQEVKFQLFANVIIEDKIFGLASSQFIDQKFDTVRNFLMEVISTFKMVKDKNYFDKLCEQ